MRKIGVQLYTLRETIKGDVPGTLRAIADAGYAGIEWFGPYLEMAHTEHRSLVRDLGLATVGVHAGLVQLSEPAVFNRLCTMIADLGGKHVGLAYLSPEQRGGLDTYLKVAATINEAGKVAKDHGLTFMYHNHDFEFVLLEDGRTALDVLLGETDPALVKSELDVFWASFAGVDPVRLMRRHGARFPVLHIKDMNAAREFEIVGDGTLDMGAIMAEGERLGVDWFVVEQDRCPKGEVESIRRSRANLRARGWG
jgi:sugar phosphate isomerase/epimerase